MTINGISMVKPVTKKPTLSSNVGKNKVATDLYNRKQNYYRGIQKSFYGTFYQINHWVRNPIYQVVWNVKQILLLLLVISLSFLLSCSQGEQDLGVILKNNHVCIYTPEFDGDESVLRTPNVKVYEIYRSQESDVYRPSLPAVKFPITRRGCIELSMIPFKLDTVYEISLDGGPPYRARVCLSKHRNRLILTEAEYKDGRYECEIIPERIYIP